MLNPLVNLKNIVLSIKSGFNNTNKNKIRLLIIGDTSINNNDIDICADINQFFVQRSKTYNESLLLIKKIDFDLIFIDFEMENIEAINSIRKLDSNTYRIPLVAVSTPNEIGETLTILSYGFDDYLIKPVKHKNLENILNRWLSNIVLRINETDKACFLEGENIKKDNYIYTTEKNTTSDSIHKILDIEASLKYSHQNKELARDLLLLLITSIEPEKNKAIDFYKKSKWKEIGEIAHKLYGGSCYCGVSDLQEKTKAIEKAVNENNVRNIKIIFPELINAMDDLLLWHETYDIDVVFSLK